MLKKTGNSESSTRKTYAIIGLAQKTYRISQRSLDAVKRNPG
jgi:hypothetical protein